MASLVQTIKSVLESKNSFKIAFIGDSITAAEWIHPNWREIIEYVLKEELTKQFEDWKIPSWGIRCFNYGFDGSTTRDIKEFVSTGTIPTNPDLVIYLLGNNDKYAKVPTDEYLSNVKNTISKFTCPIILCSNPTVNNPDINEAYEKTYYQSFLNLLSNPNLICLDLFKETQKYDLTSFYTLINVPGNEVTEVKPGEEDFLHPNRLGNAYIAKIILETAFQIPFNPEKYLEDLKNDIMDPTYQ